MRRRLACLVLLCMLVLPSFTKAGNDPFVGEIAMYGFTFPPSGWALCNGQLLQISTNTALFSLLGTIYGGDGRTTFRLPDFRGRVPMHFGAGPGLSSRSIGQKSGAESNSEVAAHTHATVATVMGTDERGDSEAPGGNIWARKARERDYHTAPPAVQLVSMHVDALDVQVISTGSPSVNNMQPYQVVNFSIALVGVYPSSN